LAATLPFALWIPLADAPELVTPLLSMTIGGGLVFIVAATTAYLSRPVKLRRESVADRNVNP
jgi:hypothetical protein